MLIQMNLDPMGAQRTRSAGKIHYTPTKYRKWLEDFVKLAVANVEDKIELGMGEPIWIDILANFQIPKSKRRGKGAYAVGQPHTNRPDIDNAAKGIFDGLVKAGLLPDDAQIASLSMEKKWADAGGIVVTVRKL